MDFKRRTKIVCTLGPASSSPSVIEGLIRAGMNVARLNFSHGTFEDHASRIQIIRETSARLETPIAILQDLPGPKIRTGRLAEREVVLDDGADFTLTTRETPGDAREVSVSLPTLPQAVKRGDTILLGDGEIELEVVSTTETDIKLRVVSGGVLGWKKGITVPEASLDVSAITAQDLTDLDFGIAHGVDFVALSFVRNAEDVLGVRTYLNEKGLDVPLIAKIEKREAWKNLDQVLEVSDGLMVARGDLGMEIPIQKVPLAQKEIIHKCNQAGKPVITATQMLDSMVEASRPTRAEVTDVANSIFDGTDAIMLSNETAIGRYPLKAVRMMARIALETEGALPYRKILAEKGADLEPQTDDAIAYAACHIAQQLGATAIVAFTASGSTARRVAKYRPGVPILAITPNPDVGRRSLLSWGVYPYTVDEPATTDKIFEQGVEASLSTGLAANGDLIVITAGLPVNVPGTTNLLKVEQIARPETM